MAFQLWAEDLEGPMKGFWKTQPLDKEWDSLGSWGFRAAMESVLVVGEDKKSWQTA